MRRKTAGRILTVQALYQLDLRGEAFLDEAPAYFRDTAKNPADAEIADTIFHHCLEKRDALDARLAAVAEHWDLARMAIVDRAILRLGAYELLYCPEVPPKVAVNEAIRLAKKYSTAESGAFVNGILDKLMTARAPTPDAPRE